MAAGKLQRWAMFLAGFDYNIVYVKGSENGAADGLSRLPLKMKEEDLGEDYLKFVERSRPIDACLIRVETKKDKLLSAVLPIINGDTALEEISAEMKAFVSKKDELYVEEGIIMWGYRVVIPKVLQEGLLNELHGAHMGAAKMKNLARTYFWWPNLDKDIEHFVSSCILCVEARPNPPLAKLIKWPDSVGVFDRVHVDFLGPVSGKMFFILTDAFSKWTEIYEMPRTDAGFMIDKLKDIFARYGLPNKIVSDNGPQFVSAEYREFCHRNGIRVVTSPPFHPSTNGAAENAVKTFKACLLKFMKDSGKGMSVSSVISRYLFNYRNTPHWVTGECPSMLMFGRKVRTRLDLLKEFGGRKEDQYKHFRGKREVEFEEGETCFARDYKNPNKRSWKKGVVEEVLGKRIYLVRILENNVIWKRHLDQIIKSGDFYKNPSENLEYENKQNSDLSKEFDDDLEKEVV